jgi:hypothetical protein
VLLREQSGYQKPDEGKKAFVRRQDGKQIPQAVVEDSSEKEK